MGSWLDLESPRIDTFARATLGGIPLPGSVQEICVASGILALNPENVVVSRGKLPNNPNSFDFD